MNNTNITDAQFALIAEQKEEFLNFVLDEVIKTNQDLFEELVNEFTKGK